MHGGYWTSCSRKIPSCQPLELSDVGQRKLRKTSPHPPQLELAYQTGCKHAVMADAKHAHGGGAKVARGAENCVSKASVPALLGATLSQFRAPAQPSLVLAFASETPPDVHVDSPRAARARVR